MIYGIYNTSVIDMHSIHELFKKKKQIMQDTSKREESVAAVKSITHSRTFLRVLGPCF
jgi:hypothetical protein